MFQKKPDNSDMIFDQKFPVHREGTHNLCVPSQQTQQTDIATYKLN